jgi:hypothetical protein
MTIRELIADDEMKDKGEGLAARSGMVSRKEGRNNEPRIRVQCTHVEGTKRWPRVPCMPT